MAVPAGVAVSRWPDRLRSVISRGAVLLFLGLAAYQAAKPLLLDNMDFPAVAAATAQSGKPIYYRGEENPLHSGLYHPPLYIYLLAGWFRLFGSGPAQARMFGALCALLQGWLVLRLLGRLCGEERVRRWHWLFWLFFLLNPYTLQTSSIPDIDSSIYGPLLTLVLWGVLRIGWRDGRFRDDQPRWWEAALVALFLMAAFWAKLTTVFLLIPFIFLFLVPRLGWKRAMAVTAGISIAGVGGFLLTYYLYGAFTALNVNYTFQFLYSSVFGPGRLLSYGANYRAMLPFMVRWTGLLPWFCVSAVLAATVHRWWKTREPRALYYLGLLSFSAICVLYYCGQVTAFSYAPFKYTFVVWALLTTAPVLAVAWLWTAGASEDAGRRFEIADVSATVWLGAGVWLVGLWMGGAILQDGLLLILKMSLVRQALWILVPVGLAVADLIARAVGRRGLRLGGVGLAAWALLLHAGIQAGIASYQSRAQYSTTYNYGQRGIEEAAAFIQASTTEQDVISSMKDIGFLAKRRYYENYGALYNDDASARLIVEWESGRISYIVFTEGCGPDQLSYRPVLRDWVAVNAELVASFGDYRIYRPRKQPSATGSNPR
jgi:hypothetical protein